MAPLYPYGWTITQLKIELHGRITYVGGSHDGISSMATIFDTAVDGEVWCVEQLDEPPWMYGKVGQAHRTIAPIAERFLRGEIELSGAQHCLCD